MLHMYSETLSQKVDANTAQIIGVFNFISNDWDTFGFDDYNRALDEDEELFDWLERPKEMMQQMLTEDDRIYEREFVDNLLDDLFNFLTYEKVVLQRVNDVLNTY